MMAASTTGDRSLCLRRLTSESTSVAADVTAKLTPENIAGRLPRSISPVLMLTITHKSKTTLTNSIEPAHLPRIVLGIRTPAFLERPYHNKAKSPRTPLLQSGVWTPRLAWSGAGGGTADAATRTGQVQFEVRNWGVVPVRVEGPATLSMAGVTATATTDGPVGPLARGVLRVELRVDDCARVPRSDPEAGSSVTVDVPMWHGIAPLTFGDVASSQLVAGVVDGICGRS